MKESAQLTRFVPNNFKPRQSDIDWAIKEFDISREEVFRHLDGDRDVKGLRDHEFPRPYTDWNRVFKNWLKKAYQLGHMRRERKAYKAEEYTEEDRKADAAKSWAVLNKLKGI